MGAAEFSDPPVESTQFMPGLEGRGCHGNAGCATTSNSGHHIEFKDADRAEMLLATASWDPVKEELVEPDAKRHKVLPQSSSPECSVSAFNRRWLTEEIHNIDDGGSRIF